MRLPELLDALRENNRTEIDASWQQGRTAFGGLSAAIALQATMNSVDDLPSLCSAQIAFVGPLSGKVEARANLLRRGKNSAYAGCDVSNSEGIGLRALFLFMNARASAISHRPLVAPDEPLDEDRLLDPARLPQGFLRQFDLTFGHHKDGVSRRWVRLKDREGLSPAVELIAVADALPPAAMTLTKGWAPVSTTTWQINLATDAPSTRDGWWLLEAQSLDAGDGSASQSMTVWNRDLELMATATQSVALFI